MERHLFIDVPCNFLQQNEKESVVYHRFFHFKIFQTTDGAWGVTDNSSKKAEKLQNLCLKSTEHGSRYSRGPRIGFNLDKSLLHKTRLTKGQQRAARD
jgi:hypothetical protein